MIGRSNQAAGGLYIMKIRTENEIKEFNAALDKCTTPVWLMGPNDEAYNMKSADGYVKAMTILTEGEGEQFGIFTGSYNDEAFMTEICHKMAA